MTPVADEPPPTSSTTVPVLAGLMCGAVSGGIARTTIAPLERAKIIFQTSERVFSVRAAVQILKDTYIQDGVKGLWRGNGVEMIRILPYAALQFMSHEYYKKILLQKDEKHLPPFRRFIAGALAGATSVTCTYPLDLMRVRLAVQHRGNQQYRGLADAFRHIRQSHGVGGLFRGLPATILGVLPYAGISFFTFESLKLHLLQFRHHDDLTVYERLVSGALAGLIGQSATYPLDIVRRRMQTDGFLNERRHMTIRETFVSVAQTQGVIKGLYKGLSMNWFKGPIAVAISFTTFDTLKVLLRKDLGIDISMRNAS